MSSHDLDQRLRSVQLGLLLSLAMSGRVCRRTRQGRVAYRTLRETFGGVLLLGLEILVAADLVRTVAVDPTLESSAILGLIVLRSCRGAVRAR